MNERVEHLLWLMMEDHIHRYLMANAEGRCDGYAKAMHHIELCKIYVASVRMCEVDNAGREHVDADDWTLLYSVIHDASQDLTSFMDEVIGFPITGRPDYEVLAPKFFKEFVRLADEKMLELCE